jgi:DNA-binding winged helix-turn-helix (wHTH) protein
MLAGGPTAKRKVASHNRVGVDLLAAADANRPLRKHIDSRIEVDPSLRVLRIGKDAIQLTPKSFDVLSYLFERQDRVVPKLELLSEFWPSGRNQHSLHQEIYSLRRLLASHGLVDCIVTVSRYGYRFKAKRISALPNRSRVRDETRVMPWKRVPFAAELLSEAPVGPYLKHMRPFEKLIGNWVINVVDIGWDGTNKSTKGTWSFHWGLGGRAILDVWHVPGREQGLTVRFYDECIGAFRSTWIAPRGGKVMLFTGRFVNGGIVLC